LKKDIQPLAITPILHYSNAPKLIQIEYAHDKFPSFGPQIRYSMTRLSGLVNVAMNEFHLPAGLSNLVTDLTGDRHGAVSAAGAADSNGQIRLAFLLIQGNQEVQKIHVFC
jgi:hypothetical protein